jgi:hypothetical protein
MKLSTLLILALALAALAYLGLKWHAAEEVEDTEEVSGAVPALSVSPERSASAR